LRPLFSILVIELDTPAFRLDARLLVIDNYDSFTFNLVQMFRQFGLRVTVFRADKITVERVAADEPDYILISPGPKAPDQAGISTELIRRLHRDFLILGVCLGMQCMNEAFGGTTIRAPVPMHGKTSDVRHVNRGLFAGVPNPVRVARYHSLAVSEISGELEITATAPDGVIMGLSHREFPTHGVQFHPESFLTESGFAMIGNFLRSHAPGSKTR
jgi:anthranilate synthase component 2